jgi:hypothetical protein
VSAPADSRARARADLLARVAADRAAVADAFSAVRGRLKTAEAVVSVVRRANRDRALTGALAVLAIVAPFAARSWLKRAAWILPLVVEGMRLARSPRDDRRAPAD